MTDIFHAFCILACIHGEHTLYISIKITKKNKCILFFLSQYTVQYKTPFYFFEILHTGHEKKENL
jgi:hypothetical protein